MGLIRNKTEEAAIGLQTQLAAQAQIKYVYKVMEWEECDWEEALAICTRRTDPLEPQYSLGYKLADPVWQLAIFGQHNKKKRENAILNFEDLLEEDELKIFREEVLTMNGRQMFRAALKREKKKAKRGEL